MKRVSLIVCSALTVFLANGSELAPSLLTEQSHEATPSHIDYFNQGTQALRQNNIAEAISHFQRALHESPNNPHILFNLALAYEMNEQTGDAIATYKSAIGLKDDYAKAHLQLAKLHQKGGKIHDAIEGYKKALTHNSELVEPALTLARLLTENEQFEESLPYFRRYLQHNPESIQVRFEYANTLNTVHKSEQALSIYEELLKIRPNDSGILYNTAYTLKRLGRIKDAMPYYEKTLQKNPNHSEAQFSLGLTYLAMGEFEKGWPLYEWRWKRKSQLTERNFTQPQWDGTSLDGKTLLLHAEQGLGDSFQFVRYAKVLKERYDVRIFFASQTILQEFIARCCPYFDQVSTLHDAPAQFDVHAPLLSLPYILNSDEDSIPRDIPYIFPDEDLVSYWKERIKKDTNFKVGICWQGNNKYSTPFLRAVVAAKSMKLKSFSPLAQVSDVSFYSLQKVTGTEQLNDAPTGLNLITFEDNFDDAHGRFMDTAALIKNLDLVITIDTSISHLAAAIGTPVWILLPEPADWRWMLDRQDTPWYPNMRLFRQPEVGNWDAVIERIVIELDQLVHNKPHVLEQPSCPEISMQCLKKEKEQLQSLFKRKAQKLSGLSLSTNDQAFMKQLRTLYLVAEMHSHVNDKIRTLQES